MPEKNFKFIITSENEEFENNYIMKYRCPCGGKYKILLREKIEEKDKIYNLIKSMCIVCNRPEEFCFDITSRFAGKSNDEPEESYKDIKENRRDRISDSPSFLSDIARDIQDAFISLDDLNELPVNLDDLANLAGHGQGSLEHRPDTDIKDFEKLKLLYAQAMLKIGFLEEENSLKQMLEERLNERDAEIKALEKIIEELREELEDRTAENKDLKRQFAEKEQEIEEYKRSLGEKKQSGWKKLLGG